MRNSKSNKMEEKLCVHRHIMVTSKSDNQCNNITHIHHQQKIQNIIHMKNYRTHLVDRQFLIDFLSCGDTITVAHYILVIQNKW